MSDAVIRAARRLSAWCHKPPGQGSDVAADIETILAELARPKLDDALRDRLVSALGTFTFRGDKDRDFRRLAEVVVDVVRRHRE